MVDPFREPLDPRIIGLAEDVELLKKDVEELRARAPKEPFQLRLWHTLFLSLSGIAGVVIAFGVIYDKFQPSGLKISLFLTAGLVGFILILTAISSLAALDSKWRKDGLGSPWRKPKDQREE
jgi:lipopolysaccharide export LptBFGC system permease protein LptF